MLQPKTVANYVRDVGVGLDNLLCADSILEVSPDALEELYELMLEAQPTSSMRRNLARGLLEFHGHLQKTFAYPPISPYSTLGIGKTPQFVDAQILNEDQYRLGRRLQPQQQPALTTSRHRCSSHDDLRISSGIAPQ